MQNEISLHHVRQDGTFFEGAARLKTHRLHSIVYGNGSCTVATSSADFHAKVPFMNTME